MEEFVIRSASGEWDAMLQEWVDRGDGSRYQDEETAYDVASQLTGRALRIENTQGRVITRLSRG